MQDEQRHEGVNLQPLRSGQLPRGSSQTRRREGVRRWRPATPEFSSVALQQKQKNKKRLFEGGEGVLEGDIPRGRIEVVVPHRNEKENLQRSVLVILFRERHFVWGGVVLVRDCLSTCVHSWKVPRKLSELYRKRSAVETSLCLSKGQFGFSPLERGFPIFRHRVD